MPVTELELYQEQSRSNWVRLRTLVTLRWAAITGQIVAVVVAVSIYHMQIAVGLVTVTIGASVVANLFSIFLFPENRRLSEREAAVILAFDVLQLGLLLYLTGGLNNPFALLMLAPVTIAATVLHLRSTIFLGLIAMTILTLIARWHVDLMTADDITLEMPRLFQFGFWAALMIGVAFLGIYARQVTNEMHAMGEALVATQLALAREQKLTALGGVVAAAAHELGTPLATIKLVSSEMLEELGDQPELRADAALIRQQADRCRDILRSMGRAGKEDVMLRHAPLESVIQEAAEPHIGRGKTVHFDFARDAGNPAQQPVILRRPEVIHGLRNLIQNAVDFANTSVEIEADWTDRAIIVRIEDDGPGFPTSILGRIGDPFMRGRRVMEERAQRPGYEGMGLGLFIAKTLLERSGARLSFANGVPDPHGDAGGAIVIVKWPHDKIVAKAEGEQSGLGENIPIHA